LLGELPGDVLGNVLVGQNVGQTRRIDDQFRAILQTVISITKFSVK